MNAKPQINVTPLIDVLLVLLIIFMVITPLKPTDFKAKIPSEPNRSEPGNPNPDTLVVKLDKDYSLKVNNEDASATVQDSENLTKKLVDVFQVRLENRHFATEKEFKNDLTDMEKVQKTVFIKAPRSMDYGSVAKVIDAVKLSGAEPISLQIDDLE
jgi:biopolymer transport protein ExbD